MRGSTRDAMEDTTGSKVVSSPTRMYEVISLSSSFLPAAAMSSARTFILLKKSTIIDDLFCAVASAMHVFITSPQDCKAVISRIIFQILAAAVQVDTWT